MVVSSKAEALLREASAHGVDDDRGDLQDDNFNTVDPRIVSR